MCFIETPQTIVDTEYHTTALWQMICKPKGFIEVDSFAIRKYCTVPHCFVLVYFISSLPYLIFFCCYPFLCISVYMYTLFMSLVIAYKIGVNCVQLQRCNFIQPNRWLCIHFVGRCPAWFFSILSFFCYCCCCFDYVSDVQYNIVQLCLWAILCAVLFSCDFLPKSDTVYECEYMFVCVVASLWIFPIGF